MGEMNSALNPPSFQSLAQAVGFIAERIERNASEELLAAFAHIRNTRPYTPFECEMFTTHVFPKLCQRHQEKDLRKRYKRLNFDPNENQHKLGGHEAELGHIHIDFVKTASGWVLEEIWQCR